MSVVLLILLATIGGAAVTLQGQFMGLMDQRMGTRESVFITYASGGLLVAALMLVSRGGKLGAWHAVPWYALSTGALGLIIVGIIGYVVPRLGLATGFTVLVASQFVVAAVIDHLGLFGAALRPLEATRLLGLGLLLVSVWMIVR